MSYFFKKVFISLAICVVTTTAFGDELGQRIVRAVDKLIAGDPSDLIITSFLENPHAAAEAFALQLNRVEDERAKQKLIHTISAVEEMAVRQPSSNRPLSTNTLLASHFIHLLQTDSSIIDKTLAAQTLSDLFAPVCLEEFHTAIADVATSVPQREIILLYGQLPGQNQNDMEKFIQSISNRLDQETQKIIPWLRARYGDQDAQNTLIAEMAALHETSYFGLAHRIDGLSYAGTDKIIRALAQGLRSEETIALANGASVPKRNAYAWALVKTMRYQTDFPVRKESLIYSDDELSTLEQWCAQNLGVTFPTEPRTPLEVTPGVCF